MARWYVGHTHGGSYKAFSAARKPTERGYTRVDGPFATQAGARTYAAAWNAGGPVTQHQAEARKLASRGDMPAPPKRVATAYAGGQEIAVYEKTDGRYFAHVGRALSKTHGTIREAVSAGRQLAEGPAQSISAAYSRATRNRSRTRRAR